MTFEANLTYIVSFRSTRNAEWGLVLTNETNPGSQKKKEYSEKVDSSSSPFMPQWRQASCVVSPTKSTGAAGQVTRGGRA